MEKLTTNKQINKLALLFAVTYMVSYITRINYGAVVSAMESDTGVSRSLLSLALTGSFVTYGTGQIISGICGDRLSPKRLVMYGLIVTIVMNLLIPICTNPYQMLAVWCVNGFAQAFMWPPMVRLMTALLREDDYKRVNAKVSWGSCMGTIVIYLISPVFISTLGWKSVFIFSAVCGIIMVFVWNKYAIEIPKENDAAVRKSEKSGAGKIFTPLMIFIMLAIILQGMLRDGVTTWMPSYISETYHLNNSISILTNVIMPVFSIICIHFVTKLYMNKFENPLTCAGVIFAIGAAASLGVVGLSGVNAAFSVVFSAILTGCMHGVNLMLIAMIPPFFKKYGNVSTVSGVVNSCTYIGSAISTYGIAAISERIGWSVTLCLWVVIAVFGTAICFACARPWRKKHMCEE